MKKILASLLAAAVLSSSMAATALAASFEIEQIVAPTYEAAGSFTNGLAAVKQNGKWGYIDETGKMVIAPKYDWAGQFSEGVAVVALYDSETYDEGTEYAYTSEWYDLYLLFEGGTDKQLMYDTYGEGVQPLQYYVDTMGDRTIESDGYSWFCQNGVLNVEGTPFDANGNEIKVKNLPSHIDEAEMIGPCIGGVIAMYGRGPEHDSGTAFYMDKNGNITRTFPSYGESKIVAAYAPEQDRILAQVGEYTDTGDWDGGWGAMDMNGNWVVQPVYANFRLYMSGKAFSDGLLTVQAQSGKYGAVDKNGKVVLPMQYDFLTSFREGMCAAKQNGTFFFLDLAGKRYDIGAVSGGAAARVDAASMMTGGVSPVYVAANGQAYCIQNVPKNGVLPAIAGTQNLGREVYFPEYDESADDLGTIVAMDDIIAIKEGGKWGFSKMTFHLDLPDESAMDSWAYDEVCKAIEAGLVPNSLQNQYRSNITRGDFALLLTEVATTITGKDLKMLVKDTTGKELDALVKAMPFTDTSSESVIAANALGILNGYGNGKFGPYDTISRQDAATMLLRAATAIKADAMDGWGDKIAAASVQFADGAAFSAYAKQAIEVMAALDVMKGTGNNQFSPKATYTRQQSFMTVYRLMNQILEGAA